MTFLPNDIWIIINSFLGVNYWYNRKKLTVLSKAVDFITSDYSNNSYWKWNRWRKNKYNLDIHIIKPTLPHRFRNIISNPYIISVDPPKYNKSLTILDEQQKEYSNKIYN